MPDDTPPPNETTGAFRDHFSTQSRDYAAYRPDYPPALFAWLAARAPARRAAWDCATGSGQAAVGLARHFARVVATDASAAQLAQAAPAPNVEYAVARAEASGLAGGAVDLVNVAQALHWFDRDRFFAEARRVLVPGGLLALSSYGSARLDEPALADAFGRFEHETLGAWWPEGRAGVGEALREVPMPFAELDVPPFALAQRWTLAGVLGYARSWSATARWAAAHDGRDPVLALAETLGPLWGDPSRERTVTWPFVVRVGVAA